MGGTPKAIVFLLGPSGSGKTELAKRVAADLHFCHIEIDRWPVGDGIDLAGLRTEWDAFLGKGQPAGLASAIGKRIMETAKDGAILSFPSKLVLPTVLMEAAEGEGIQFLILYRTGADCLEAFLRRECQTDRGLGAAHWIANNADTYAECSRPELSKNRLTVFEQSCHRPWEDLVAEVKRRVVG